MAALRRAGCWANRSAASARSPPLAAAARVPRVRARRPDVARRHQPPLPKRAILARNTSCSSTTIPVPRRRRPRKRPASSEYSAWAGALAASRSLVGAEKLRGAEVTFVRDREERREARLQSPGGLLGGFFLVRAATEAEAQRIARECPHLRHGGRVVLRPVEPTRG